MNHYQRQALALAASQPSIEPLFLLIFFYFSLRAGHNLAAFVKNCHYWDQIGAARARKWPAPDPCATLVF